LPTAEAVLATDVVSSEEEPAAAIDSPSSSKKPAYAIELREDGMLMNHARIELKAIA
jgi:hypothetical protein